MQELVFEVQDMILEFDFARTVLFLLLKRLLKHVHLARVMHILELDDLIVMRMHGLYFFDMVVQRALVVFQLLLHRIDLAGIFFSDLAKEIFGEMDEFGGNVADLGLFVGNFPVAAFKEILDFLFGLGQVDGIDIRVILEGGRDAHFGKGVFVFFETALCIYGESVLEDIDIVGDMGRDFHTHAQVFGDPQF